MTDEKIPLDDDDDTEEDMEEPVDEESTKPTEPVVTPRHRGERIERMTTRPPENTAAR